MSLFKPWTWFRSKPEVEEVSNPFPEPSRTIGDLIRRQMDSDSDDHECTHDTIVCGYCDEAPDDCCCEEFNHCDDCGQPEGECECDVCTDW